MAPILRRMAKRKWSTPIENAGSHKYEFQTILFKV